MISISGLFRKLLEMHAAPINTDRRAGLHAVGSETKRDKLLRETCHGWFSHTATGESDTSNMYQTIQECTVGQHNAPGAKLDT